MEISTDEKYMKIALELSAGGIGFTSPNPVVGAVVVKENKIVGKGFHEFCGGPHAEVNAINEAGNKCIGATIYVTLEPCNHTGKTPPCTEKILKSGITNVVIAMEDPNPIVSGSGVSFLNNHGITTKTGILEKEAKKINEVFIKNILTKRPFNILKYGATLDGRIATKTGDSKWVTGPDSRKYVHELRHRLDGIMVGIDTVKQDNPSLTTRLDGKKTSDPHRIILDSKFTFPENAKMITLESEAKTLIIAGNNIFDNPELLEKRIRLEKKGVQVVEAIITNGLIDLDKLMDQLGGMGITSILIEGGSRTIHSSLKAGIVDKVTLFYAPKILSGDDGIPVCRGEGPSLMKDCINLKDIEVHRFGVDIMIEGYI